MRTIDTADVVQMNSTISGQLAGVSDNDIFVFVADKTGKVSTSVKRDGGVVLYVVHGPDHTTVLAESMDIAEFDVVEGEKYSINMISIGTSKYTL